MSIVVINFACLLRCHKSKLKMSREVFNVRLYPGLSLNDDNGLSRVRSSDPDCSSLSIYLNEYTAKVAEEAGSAIQNNSVLRHLNVISCRECRPELYKPLIQGISKNMSISSLNINNGGGDTHMWGLLAQLTTMYVRSLTLSGGEIDVRMSNMLSYGISRNTCIENITLFNIQGNFQPTKNIFDSICTPNSSVMVLKVLYVRDVLIQHLADALTHGKSLKELTLCHLDPVTEAGWISFFSGFSQETSNLSTLKVFALKTSNDDDINDNVVRSMIDALCRNNKLEELHIGYSPSITEHGWVIFSQVFRNSSISDSISALKEVYIDCCSSFTDVALAAFIEGLRVNSTLEGLFIQFPSQHERDRISLTLTLEGLEAYVGLLCDTTNVQATRYSNHTLYHIDHLESMSWYQWLRILGLANRENEDLERMRKKISHLLRMNAELDKNTIARRKVIMSHFPDGSFDVNTHHALVEKELLPQTIHWFARDELGFSVVYDLLKKNSGSSINSSFISKKRRIA